LPDNIKAIMNKVSTDRSPQEVETLEMYHSKDVREIARTEVDQTGLYAVAFRPDAAVVATAGADGTVRLVDAATGKVTSSFVPVPISPASAAKPAAPPDRSGAGTRAPRSRAAAKPAGPAGVEALEVLPATVRLANRLDY